MVDRFQLHRALLQDAFGTDADSIDGIDHGIVDAWLNLPTVADANRAGERIRIAATNAVIRHITPITDGRLRKKVSEYAARIGFDVEIELIQFQRHTIFLITHQIVWSQCHINAGIAR